MLGSINPLGERGRGSKWMGTVTAFAVGSVVAGAAVGVAMGTVGRVLVGGLPANVRGAAVAAVVLGAAAWDTLLARRRAARLPGPRRQVDEDWLASYRGWVYGVSFGFQLGLGVATIVTTAAVYAALAGAFLTGSVPGGLVVGAVFGLARALPVLAGGRIRHPRDLLRLDALLRRWDRPALGATVALQAAVATAALGLLVAR